MQSIEVLLLLVNLLALLVGIRRQSKRVWWGLAGINIGVLLLHAFVEGLRYPMAFSYLFVALLVGVALTTGKTKTPRVLKGIGFALAVVGLGGTALLAYALPVFTLPTPTGAFPIGVTYHHLIDENRPDPFLDTVNRPRELMVKIYYPAAEANTTPVAPYFNGSPALIQLFTAHYGLPDFMFAHLLLVETHTKADVPLSEAQPRYPVILVSHGAGGSMETQATQSEDLASHGYIVVAIDHTYASLGTVFPDRAVSAREATTNFNVVEPAAPISQIMAEDAQFVLDALSEMDSGTRPSRFQSRLDLEAVGMIGHSVGGAVAYNLALTEPRIKAAINLDGVVYMTPPTTPANIAPLLMVANDQYHLQAIEARRPLIPAFAEMPDLDQAITVDIYGSEGIYTEAYNQAQRNVQGLAEVLAANGELFTVQGCDHMKFIDLGLFFGLRPLRELFGIRGDTEPSTCLAITSAVSVAFFDQHLKNESPTVLESLPTTYPPLIKVELQ